MTDNKNKPTKTKDESSVSIEHCNVDMERFQQRKINESTVRDTLPPPPRTPSNRDNSDESR
jgi:hypothetical protein